jgi:hypothetical protein
MPRVDSSLAYLWHIQDEPVYARPLLIATRANMVRKEILGASERRVLEAYLKGERLKGYNTLLWRIHTIGLKAIISGCEHDLAILMRLLKLEEQKPAN